MLWSGLLDQLEKYMFEWPLLTGGTILHDLCIVNRMGAPAKSMAARGTLYEEMHSSLT